AYDSVLAYQSDNPEGLRGRAAALALAGRSDEAFRIYEEAVRARTGVADLRCDFARDLLWAGRTADAKAQLEAARLLDAENPTATRGQPDSRPGFRAPLGPARSRCRLPLGMASPGSALARGLCALEASDLILQVLALGIEG